MVKSESFPICMWLPLTEFTDHSETVFSIDNHWVFSYKSSWYHHRRVKLIFLLSLGGHLCLIFENEWLQETGLDARHVGWNTYLSMIYFLANIFNISLTHHTYMSCLLVHCFAHSCWWFLISFLACAYVHTYIFIFLFDIMDACAHT